MPGAPKLLTKLSTISYNRSYTLIWERPSESSEHPVPVFYYGIRYRKVGKTVWRLIDEIQAAEKQTKYSYEIESFDWNVKYDIEVYAGNTFGVGSPANGTIQRPNGKLRFLYKFL